MGISRYNRHWLEPDKSIKIEQVRQLISNLYKKPIDGGLAAGIILEAERATVEAQNALLKLLEEPPQTARLFLSAPNPKHLLPTIVSRCKIIKSHTTPLLDKQTTAEIEDVVAQLAGPKNIKTAFHLAERYGSSRESADEFLQNALLYIHQQFCSGPPRWAQYLDFAKKVTISRRLLSANVNPRQVLENLFFDLYTP